MTLFSTVLPTSPGLPQGSLSRLVILAFCSIFFFASVQNVSSTSAIVCFLFFENPAKKRWHTSTTNRGCISLYCKSMAAMLHDTVVAMRTHPWAILLAMITMRKSIRLNRTTAILDWRHILLTSMRGHACKGQLPAIEETRRSSAIMPNRDHCCVPQCQNNRANIFQISPFTNFRVINPFDSSGLSKYSETWAAVSR